MERPIPLDRAIDAMEGDALATIAAFLLLARVWHRSEFTRSPLVPREDLDEAGFDAWNRSDPNGRGKVSLRDLGDEGQKWPQADFLDEAISGSANDRLATAIRRALRTGSRVDAARAIYEALFSPSPLVRVCAQISALDLISLDRTADRVHALYGPSALFSNW
jgi:hypothetical protein